MSDDTNSPVQIDDLDRLAALPIDDADLKALDVLLETYEVVDPVPPRCPRTCSTASSSPSPWTT